MAVTLSDFLNGGTCPQARGGYCRIALKEARQSAQEAKGSRYKRTLICGIIKCGVVFKVAFRTGSFV